MNYRKSRGVIIAVHPHDISVRLAAKENYSSCAEKGCHLCAAPTKSMELNIPVTTAPEFRLGDSVVVSLPIINEALAASIVFLIPIIVAVIVGSIIAFGFHWSIESGKSVATILISFAVSFVIPVLIDHLIKRRYPVTVEKHEVTC